MAEFKYWGTTEDSIEIVEAIFALGEYAMLPDLHYPDAHPCIYTKSDASLSAVWDKRPQVFVSGPYTKTSPCLREFNDGSRTVYFYVDEVVGPLLSLTVSRDWIRDGGVEISGGSLFRQAEYWNLGRTKATKASDELKFHYKRICAEIRRHLLPKKIGNINIGICKRAWSLLTSKKAIILNGGYWLDVDGNSIKSIQIGKPKK
jgi:hypothetical protein